MLKASIRTRNEVESIRAWYLQLASRNEMESIRCMVSPASPASYVSCSKKDEEWLSSQCPALLHIAGHYVYYYNNRSLSVPDQVLLFASHQFVCGLSFSYFALGALSLDIIWENRAVDSVYSSPQEGMANSSSSSLWERASFARNTTGLDPPESGSSLYFEISDFDLGESPLLSNQELFLALDNVTLTFCLPCDYDTLVEPGAIEVRGPRSIDIALRRLSTYQFNATTPACPNETLFFEIDSGS